MFYTFLFQLELKSCGEWQLFWRIEIERMNFISVVCFENDAIMFSFNSQPKSKPTKPLYPPTRRNWESHYFGVPLQNLVTPDRPIPLFIEKCVDYIERTGRLRFISSPSSLIWVVAIWVCEHDAVVVCVGVPSISLLIIGNPKYCMFCYLVGIHLSFLWPLLTKCGIYSCCLFTTSWQFLGVQFNDNMISPLP